MAIHPLIRNTSRIHIFGAAGSGTSTLGAALACRLNVVHLDADDFYWKPTDPPFVDKNGPDTRVSLILSKIKALEEWVLSGSLCSWGDPLLGQFNLAIFLELDPVTRLARLKNREKKRYGSRIAPDGDLYHHHIRFMEWAASYDHAKAPTRSRDLHLNWMKRLDCRLLKLDSSNPAGTLVNQVIRVVAAGGF